MNIIQKRPYQTITTYVLPCTDTKPTRIKARTASGIGKVVSWDYEHDAFNNHARAAKALADSLDWDGDWAAGATAQGYVFVRMPDPDASTPTGQQELENRKLYRRVVELEERLGAQRLRADACMLAWIGDDPMLVDDITD